MSNEERSVDYVNDLPSSIEVNRGMKGDVGWSVKIRGVDGDEFDLVDRVAAIDAALSIRFRKPNPTLEEQLGASIAAASQRPQDEAAVAPTRKRVVIAGTLDKRVGERGAEQRKATRADNERAGRPNL